MKSVYGVYFYGPFYSSERVITNVPLGTVDSSTESITKLVQQFLPQAEKIKPTHGVIKELTLDDNGRVRVEKPAKLGGEKLQAFLVDVKGNNISVDTSGGKNDFYVNGAKIDLPSSLYDMTNVKGN